MVQGLGFKVSCCSNGNIKLKLRLSRGCTGLEDFGVEDLGGSRFELLSCC